MSITSGNTIVDEIACMQFTGNIIPQRWYKNILKETGKPDLLAIVLLAEIVYWYRPIEERDEATGQLKGFRTRFHNDMLQRDYEAFANQFGENKRNIRDAMVRLEKLGVIRRDFRTIVTSTGIRCSNVLFIELIPQKLYEITHGRIEESMTQNCNRGYEEEPPLLLKNDTTTVKKGSAPIQKNVTGGTQKRKTNTENTKKNTTEIISSSISSSQKSDDDDLKKQIDYDRALKEYPDTAAVVYDEILKCADRYKTILDSNNFKNLCRNIEIYAGDIGNIEAYIQTCMRNMAAGQKLKQRKLFNCHMRQDYDMAELEKILSAN